MKKKAKQKDLDLFYRCLIARSDAFDARPDTRLPEPRALTP